MLLVSFFSTRHTDTHLHFDDEDDNEKENQNTSSTSTSTSANAGVKTNTEREKRIEKQRERERRTKKEREKRKRKRQKRLSQHWQLVDCVKEWLDTCKDTFFYFSSFTLSLSLSLSSFLSFHCEHIGISVNGESIDSYHTYSLGWEEGHCTKVHSNWSLDQIR